MLLFAVILFLLKVNARSDYWKNIDYFLYRQKIYFFNLKYVFYDFVKAKFKLESNKKMLSFVTV